MRASTAAVLIVLVVLAGCGGSSKPAAQTTAGTAPAATPTGAATAPAQSQTTTAPAQTQPAGIDTLQGASTNPVSVQPANKATALLTAVRAARHEGYDRVVFQFANTLPGYDVRYVRPPVTEDGSGKPVPVKGNYVVKVRMENALDADMSKPSAPATYTGPLRFTPGTPEVVELARSGGFEGVLSWVAGLQDKVAFRVTTLASPPRLVVDFRNH